MTLKHSNLYLAILCLGVLLAASQPAQAYIDPGIGSYAIQIVIAAVVGGAFAFKSFFLRLFAGLGKKQDQSLSKDEQRDE